MTHELRWKHPNAGTVSHLRLGTRRIGIGPSAVGALLGIGGNTRCIATEWAGAQTGATSSNSTIDRARFIGLLSGRDGIAEQTERAGFHEIRNPDRGHVHA